jgi:mono/diheme cytochrome c family protein
MLALLGMILAAAPNAEAILAKYECHRCHEGTGLEALPNEKRCVGCHKTIIAGTFRAKKEILDRWRSHLVSLPDAPSLTAARPLRREWIASYLLSPVDVRPGLRATMPRLGITAEEARVVAEHLGAGEKHSKVALDHAEIEAGRALYRKLACGACHRFSGSGEAGESQLLAPDLAFARERLEPGAIFEQIRDPRPPMPPLAGDDRTARELASFVFFAPLASPASGDEPVRLPLLERKVSFEEVSERVFRRVCWHCHSSPDYARGDGGPGNTGGFGYRPRGLDLSSYAGIAMGSYDDEGRRRSVFGPLEDGTPRLVAVLLARQKETLGRSSAVIGMPLGLPPLLPEEIQLVESWIAQGRPR